MSRKMSWEGIGPKLVLTVLPYIILIVVVMAVFPSFLKMDFISQSAATAIAIIWGGIGMVFYIMTAVTFFSEFNRGRLITKGVFAWTRNPIYGCFIIFFIPALGVLFRSWLLFSVFIPLYINFKVLIREEYQILEENFGQEFLDYKARVNELIPIPKWKKTQS